MAPASFCLSRQISDDLILLETFQKKVSVSSFSVDAKSRCDASKAPTILKQIISQIECTQYTLITYSELNWNFIVSESLIIIKRKLKHYFIIIRILTRCCS